MRVKFSDLVIINVAWDTYTQISVLSAGGQRRAMTLKQCHALYGDCYVEHLNGNKVMLGGAYYE